MLTNLNGSMPEYLQAQNNIIAISGLLEKFESGDQVLADRGFLLHEEFFLRNLQLITPAFTKGKTQLLETDVTRSRRISSSRIIVERAIGHIKKWKIMTGTVPYNIVKDFNSILVIVAGLTNLAPPLTGEGMLRGLGEYTGPKMTLIFLN